MFSANAMCVQSLVGLRKATRTIKEASYDFSPENQLWLHLLLKPNRNSPYPKRGNSERGMRP